MRRYLRVIHSKAWGDEWKGSIVHARRKEGRKATWLLQYRDERGKVKELT